MEAILRHCNEKVVFLLCFTFDYLSFNHSHLAIRFRFSLVQRLWWHFRCCLNFSPSTLSLMKSQLKKFGLFLFVLTCSSFKDIFKCGNFFGIGNNGDFELHSINQHSHADRIMVTKITTHKWIVSHIFSKLKYIFIPWKDGKAHYKSNHCRVDLF